ncbi:MAG: hypothetical protein DDT21_01854 [Syntrophomonadaceae bacterium]|nr:hypothetical protein [Bacillota bacterium]
MPTSVNNKIYKLGNRSPVARAGNVIIELPAPHSPTQQEVIEWPGSGVILGGRRWGKSNAGVQRILRCIGKRPGNYWWLGISWKSASMKVAWDLLCQYTSQAPGTIINHTNYEIRLMDGSQIWARTAERPESLAGAGIMGAVMDEMTLMPENVWTEYLQGTLLDYRGWVLMMGVPKGENWASRLWRKTNSGGMGPNWKAWHVTSYQNPRINPADIDEVRRNAPDLIFRQEYLAEVIDDIGQVFRGVLATATAVRQERAIPGHTYVGGLDVARLHDFTVVTIIDVTLMEVCYMDRFSQLDFDFQEVRVQAVSDLFGVYNWTIEETGLSMQMAERLGKRGMRVTPFSTSNKSKDVIVQGLSVDIQQMTLKLLPPDDPVGMIAIGELQAYTMAQMANGGWKYGAPEGENDDCVMSIALARYGTIGNKPLNFDWSPVSIKQESVWRVR